MILGTVYGVWFAAHLGRYTSATMRSAGRTLTGLTTIALILVAVFIAWPATTPQIVGLDGEPLSGSIAELITVPIGGHDQAMMIRGNNIDTPILLYLAGGPGGTDLGAMRGAGKSYSALDPVETLTLEQTVADTIEVTNYLRDRFDEEKIYLVGNS
ncbi:MAG: hypothetical protein MUO63_21865 [Desulfobulbaceae bacterium]|nr:hypothetical protein [Desulfobulbaceae bacterium]